MLVPSHESPFKPDSTPSSVVSEMDAENACIVHNDVLPADRKIDFTSADTAVVLRDGSISSDSCGYSDSGACIEESDACGKIRGAMRQSNEGDNRCHKRVGPEQPRKQSTGVEQSTSIDYGTTVKASSHVLEQNSLSSREQVAVLNFDGTGESGDKSDDVTKNWTDREEDCNSYNLLLRTNDKYDSKGWERRAVQATDTPSPLRDGVETNGQQLIGDSSLPTAGVSALDVFQARVTRQSMQCARLRRCLRAAQLQLVTNHIATQLSRLSDDPLLNKASNSTGSDGSLHSMRTRSCGPTPIPVLGSDSRSKSIVQLVSDAAESVSDCSSNLKASAADVRAFVMRTDTLLHHVARTYDAEMTESSSDEDDDADYDDVDWAAQSLVRVPASLSRNDVQTDLVNDAQVNTLPTRRPDAADMYWPVDFVETRVALDRRLQTKLNWLRRRAAIMSRARWMCALKLTDLSEQSRCATALYARLRTSERVRPQTVRSVISLDDPDAPNYLNSRCRPFLRATRPQEATVTSRFVTPRTFETTKGKNQDTTITPLIEQLSQFANDTFHPRLSFVQDVPRSLLRALEVPAYAHTVRKRFESRTSESAGALERIAKQVKRNSALVHDRLDALKSARLDQLMSPRAVLPSASSHSEYKYENDLKRLHNVNKSLLEKKPTNEHPQSCRPARICSSGPRIKRRHDIVESKHKKSVASAEQLQKPTVPNVKRRSTMANESRLSNRKASYNHLRSSLMKSQNHVLDYSIGSAVFSHVRVEPEARSDISTPSWRLIQPTGTDAQPLQQFSNELSSTGDALNEEEAQEFTAMNDNAYCERHARAEQRERDRYDAALQRHTAQRRRSRATSAHDKVVPKLEDASNNDLATGENQVQPEIGNPTEVVNQEKAEALVHDVPAAVGARKRKFTRVRTVEYTRSTDPGWPARVFPLSKAQLDEMAVADNEARDYDRMATKCWRAVAQHLSELRCPVRITARRNRLSGSFSRSNGVAADQTNKPTRPNISQSKVESARTSEDDQQSQATANETITALELNNVEMHYVDGSCQWPTRPNSNPIFERPSNRSHSVAVPRCVARLRTRARRVRAFDLQRSPVRSYSHAVRRLGCNEHRRCLDAISQRTMVAKEHDANHESEKPTEICFTPRCTTSANNLDNAVRPSATRFSRRLSSTALERKPTRSGDSETENHWRQSGGPNVY